MGEIVFEVVIAVLILCLLTMVVIPMFRNDMELVEAAAAHMHVLDKVESQPAGPMEAAQVTGAEVVSAIRYYSIREVTIEVSTLHGSYTYWQETYDVARLSIPYEARFQCTYVYEGKKIRTVRYQQI